MNQKGDAAVGQAEGDLRTQPYEFVKIELKSSQMHYIQIKEAMITHLQMPINVMDVVS